jgi:hypothetical protein
LVTSSIKDDGEQYYEYVLMYVNNILAISYNPQAILEDVQKTFKLKNDKIGTPDYYLGANLQQKTLNNTICWTITSQDYVKAVISNVKEVLKWKNQRMPKGHVDTPMSNLYAPELDITEELNEDETSFYQELIVVLH